MERNFLLFYNFRIMPSDYWRNNKGMKNFFENMANVQFNHRTLAYVTYGVSTGKLNYFLNFSLAAFWLNFFSPVLPTHVKIALLTTYLFTNYQLANGIHMILKGVPLRLGLEHQVSKIYNPSSLTPF